MFGIGPFESLILALMGLVCIALPISLILLLVKIIGKKTEPPRE